MYPITLLSETILYFLFLHDHLFLRNVVTERGNSVPESELNSQQFTGLLLAIYLFVFGL